MTKEDKKKYNQEYYKRNKEHLKEKQRKYNEIHREKYIVRSREYRERKNAEREREQEQWTIEKKRRDVVKNAEAQTQNRTKTKKSVAAATQAEYADECCGVCKFFSPAPTSIDKRNDTHCKGWCGKQKGSTAYGKVCGLFKPKANYNFVRTI
jgi:hypothetical protein